MYLIQIVRFPLSNLRGVGGNSVVNQLHGGVTSGVFLVQEIEPIDTDRAIVRVLKHQERSNT